MIVKTTSGNLNRLWEDKKLYLYLVPITILSLFLVSTIFFVSITITPTYSQTSGNNLPNIFVATPEAAVPHQIPLKAIKQGSEISQVSAFNIDFTNVVQIPQNGSIVIVSMRTRLFISSNKC